MFHSTYPSVGLHMFHSTGPGFVTGKICLTFYYYNLFRDKKIKFNFRQHKHIFSPNVRLASKKFSARLFENILRTSYLVTGQVKIWLYLPGGQVKIFRFFYPCFFDQCHYSSIGYVCCDVDGCHVLCLRQYHGQSTTVISRHRPDMTSKQTTK